MRKRRGRTEEHPSERKIKKEKRQTTDYIVEMVETIRSDFASDELAKWKLVSKDNGNDSYILVPQDDHPIEVHVFRSDEDEDYWRVWAVSEEGDRADIVVKSRQEVFRRAKELIQTLNEEFSINIA